MNKISEETIADIEEKIAVMRSFAEGKMIQAKHKNVLNPVWFVTNCPIWNWNNCDYRVAIITPSVDWSHVAKEFRWLATDENGLSIIYENKPEKGSRGWLSRSGGVFAANALSSFRPGTCDWRESLVERPEGV